MVNCVTALVMTDLSTTVPAWDRNTYERAIRWMERPPESGAAWIHEFGLSGLCVWTLLREHLRTVRSVPDDDRAKLSASLQHFQERNTGLFTDATRGTGSDSTDLTFHSDPRARATTALALLALRAVQRRPAHAVRMLEELGGAAGAVRWLGSLNWQDPYTADDVMSVLLCLVHQAEMEYRQEAFSACHRILDWIEGIQDAKTGLFALSNDTFPWGPIAASYSLLSFFSYTERPVQRIARVVDTVLSLEERDDGLARTRGTAREGLASVGLLVLAGRQSAYRSADVRPILIRTHNALLEHQLQDGSFPQEPLPFSESVLMRALGGHSHLTRTLSTLWMRVLTMTSIERAYPDHQVQADRWNSHVWPGWGYDRPTEVVSSDEQAAIVRWIRPTAYPDVRPMTPGATPTLSVVVPCYNLGRYLHEAVESVLAQTFDDFEIIIVDDGSTDRYTRLLLAHFNRPRTLIVHQENRGLAAARNEGIRQSGGRYVCCLDPDDRLRPEFFARACAILDADPAVGFVSGHFEMFDEREGVFRFESCEFPSLLVHNVAIEPAIFRRAGWEQVGGYCTTFSTSGIEDWDLWIALLEGGYRAEIIRETMWEYRIRSDQMSTGMYRPEAWQRLVQELVARHPEAYRDHLPAVVAQHARRWVELREWTHNREAAMAWWERQAGNWERLAAHRERLLLEQQARIDRLEQRLYEYEAHAGTTPGEGAVDAREGQPPDEQPGERS